MNPTPLAASLLDARWASGPRFTPDGRTLRFISNLTGVVQQWEVPLEGGWPRQRTFIPEGLHQAVASPLPGDPRLLCQRDPSGTGRVQLYLGSDEAMPGTLLTEGYATATHTFCGWAEDGKSIYFAANRRRSDRYDLYLQTLDGSPAECLWQNEDAGYLSGLQYAPDGRRILIRRTPSNVDHVLVEIDLVTRQHRSLAMAGTAARYRAATYTPHGQHLYLITDRDADFLYLARLNLADDTLEPLATPQANVEDLALSGTGDRLAYTVNLDGYSGLFLREVRTGSTRPAPLATTAGVVHELTFAPGGDRLAFTLTRPDRPSDVFLWDLGTDIISQVTYAATATEGSVVPELVQYESFDGRFIPAWFFRPTGARSEPCPAVVYLHGGPEAQLRPGFNPLLQFLVAQGFAVLAPNVRGSTGYGRAYSHLDDGRLRQDAISDVAYAARWLRTRSDIDGARLAACGESYGGFLTLAVLAHHPALWAAGVSMAGMSSLVTFLERIGPAYRAYREAEYGSLTADRDFLLDISPLTHVCRINAPVLVVHGAKDPRVPLDEAEQFATLLKAHGTPVQQLVFEEEGHTIADPANRTHAWTTMAHFLHTHLANASLEEPAALKADASLPASSLSQADLSAMAAQAATLDERLRGEVLSSPTDAPLPSHWANWCKAAAKDDATQFSRRLAWDNLNETAAKELLGPAAWPENKPLPGWTETLLAALRTLHMSNPKSAIATPKSKPLPFAELLQPFVAVARERLVREAGGGYHALSQQAHQHLEHSLLRTLVEVAHPVLSMKWSLSEVQQRSLHFGQSTAPTPPSMQQNPARYQAFVETMQAGGWVAVLRDYPMLARLLATTTDLWVAAQVEFLARLAEDWKEIQAFFQPDEPLGIVADMRSQLSDRHNGGRSVIACTFASGLKLIYKPRAVGLEAFYNEVLAWVNTQASDLLPLKTLRILDRTTHGWVEFVQPAPCRDEDGAARFYVRMGYLLGLLYVLHGTDCHYENLFACGEHPVLIDAEMLAVPQLREPSPKKPHIRAAEAIKTETVLQTGLLPHWEHAPGGTPFDMSALMAGHPAYREPSVDRKPASSSAFRTSRATPSAHLPTLHGLPLDALDFVEEIVAGFEQMYQFLQQHRSTLLDADGPLAPLAQQHVRVIFRNTSTYAQLLRTALHPKNVRDGMAHSFHLEQLARGYRTPDGTPPFNWPMLAAERQSLGLLDVPFFTTRADSDALLLPTGERIAACFEASSLDRVQHRIAQLGDEDRSRQTRIVRQVMTTHGMGFGAPSVPPEPSAVLSETVLPMTEAALLAEACSIAHALIDEAVPLPDGSRVWLARERLRPAPHRRLSPVGYDLYSGSAGIALFLGAMAHVTGDADSRAAAYQALAPIDQALESTEMDLARLMGLGAGEGVGGVIYALTRLHRFMEDSALLQSAQHAAALITPERIAEDTRLDVLAGSAGAILGLLALYETTLDVVVLARASACGQHLLDARTAAPSGHRVWETVTPGRTLTGMSHGAAGIAYALLRLHAHTHEASLLEAAHEALAYERAVFDAEAGNWPDYRAEQQPSFWTTWCHGAPGIGLARLGCLGEMEEAMQADIDVALATTRDFGVGPMDHLCCGNFGRMDLLIEAAQQQGRSEQLTTARRQAAFCVGRVQQLGYGISPYGQENAFAPSFFQGMAGIGYQLLRLAYPKTLPSVLRWE